LAVGGRKPSGLAAFTFAHHTSPKVVQRQGLPWEPLADSNELAVNDDLAYEEANPVLGDAEDLAFAARPSPGL